MELEDLKPNTSVRGKLIDAVVSIVRRRVKIT